MVSHSMHAFADFCCSVAIAIDDILKILKNDRIVHVLLSSNDICVI